MVLNRLGRRGCPSINMRLVLGFFVFLAVMPLAAIAMPAVVDYVIDGDTFGATVMVSDDINVPVRVRISNIDAPELHGKCASEIQMANDARRRLEQILPCGAMVELSEIKDDKYLGRIDAFVATDMINDVGAVMVSEHLARPYDGGRRTSWCD